MPTQYEIPWTPPGTSLTIPSRGEIFYRYHRHADPNRPTLILLHGWTATGDLQFFTAYRTLAEHYSFVVVDHHGHGRGIRNPTAFALEDAADDAAAVLRHLGISKAIAVGYSMGGPISLLLTRRHPDLVAGLVPQATALDWLETRPERARWQAFRFAGPILRSRTVARLIRRYLHKLVDGGPSARYVGWMAGEMTRNEPLTVVQAGHALGTYDARPWADSLNVPAAMLITTKDRVVKPRKQRALAKALSAEVIEIADDHLVTITQPEAYAAATLKLVDSVAGRLGAAGLQAV